MSASQEAIETAWGQVVFDCGCPDIYYCPASMDVECPRHSGFDLCCNLPAEHIPLPLDLRRTIPHPPLPTVEVAEE